MIHSASQIEDLFCLSSIIDVQTHVTNILITTGRDCRFGRVDQMEIRVCVFCKLARHYRKNELQFFLIELYKKMKNFGSFQENVGHKYQQKDSKNHQVWVRGLY